MIHFIQSRLTMLTLIVSCFAAQGQKARPYFDELYRAGGLDRMADQFVCFNDDQESESFFIFAKSETLKAFLMENDGFKTLPAGSRAMLNKGFLSLRGYNKGIPLGDSQEQYMKDGESWISDSFHLNKNTNGRMRLRISFETMRWKRSVEVTSPEKQRLLSGAVKLCLQL